MEPVKKILNRFIVTLSFLPLLGMPSIMKNQIIEGHSRQDAILISLGYLLPFTVLILFIFIIVMHGNRPK